MLFSIALYLVFGLDRISPICLPTSEYIQHLKFVNEIVTLAGWGKTGENADASRVLQQVQIPVIDNTVCREKYQSIFRFRQIPDIRLNESSVFCAAYDMGGRDTCQGDSGGPMMLPIRDNGRQSFYQIGIVSSGLGCARPNTPGMYTNVLRQIDWIKRNLY